MFIVIIKSQTYSHNFKSCCYMLLCNLMLDLDSMTSESSLQYAADILPPLISVQQVTMITLYNDSLDVVDTKLKLCLVRFSKCSRSKELSSTIGLLTTVVESLCDISSTVIKFHNTVSIYSLSTIMLIVFQSCCHAFLHQHLHLLAQCLTIPVVD